MSPRDTQTRFTTPRKAPRTTRPDVHRQLRAVFGDRRRDPPRRLGKTFAEVLEQEKSRR